MSQIRDSSSQATGGVALSVGQTLTYAQIVSLFDLRGPQRRIMYREGRKDVALLSETAPTWVGPGDDRRECEFIGEWPASGPMRLDGANLAVVTKSPNLFFFTPNGHMWRLEGQFAYVADRFKLLVRGDRAERGLVFTLVLADSPSAGSQASPAGLRPQPIDLRGPIVVDPAAFAGETDPYQRQLLLEKALAGHRALIADLAEAFAADADARCSEDPKAFDMLVQWRNDRTKALLIEAKTLEGNHPDRVRLAVSQLLEYAYRVRTELNVESDLAIAVDRRPLMPSWFLTYLTEDRSITVIWRVGPGSFCVAGQRARLLSGSYEAFVAAGDIG